jgi:tRNA A-37 threonylcarbamoyl transferase component Bud32
MAAGDVGLTDADDPVVGRLLSERYRVLRKLGEGGMAAVYLAEHVVIQKKVALKVLAPELARREELAARFLQEARAASRIGQENVIDISDYGRADGLAFFVMEYLEGQDLGALLRTSGAISWPRARAIVVQICRALRAAHALGIIHRDLKPENVFLLEREGRADFVKLLDFGIAKVPGDLGGADSPRLTRTGMIFGTPEYMAPEQAEGKPTDHRADLYAVGCVLYHCLTGTAPFHAETFMAMLTKHLVELAEPPSLRRPDLGIPPAVDALVARALEKDRERRFQSAEAFMAAVVAIDEAGAPAPGPAPTRSARPMAEGAQRGRPASGGHATEILGPPPRITQPMPAGTPVAPVPTSPRRTSILVLATVGIALGIVAAVVFGILRRAPEAASASASPAAAPSSAPSAPGPTAAPVPEATAAPAAAPPTPNDRVAADPADRAGRPGDLAPVASPPASPRSASGAANGSTGKVERKRARREAPATTTPAPGRVAPPAPAELKPFPG